MNNAIFKFRTPANEPINSYAPGTTERKLLQEELDRQYHQVIDIPIIIGGKEIRTGDTGHVVMPTEHHHVLATYHKVGVKEVEMAIQAALEAKKRWDATPWIERCSIMMKAAELISKKYRYLLNAATMLGQGKNAFQAEIDTPCEAVDFLRFNSYYASQIYSEHPLSDNTTINRTEYRSLEGFVYAVSPFNFTAIACNLNIAPVLMGNVTLWKPATTAILSNYYLMQIYKEAGVPDGVINFLPGSGSVISDTIFASSHFAGVHFTGSTNTFNSFWKAIANNMNRYISYPKIVGETGGKDFIFAHASANVKELAVAIVRGSYEYQGQKCSAASRAYIPKSIWPETLQYIQEMIAEIKMGDVRDFSNFVNAVIDEKSFDNIVAYLERAKSSSKATIVFGGKADKSVGYFIEPTLIQALDPHYETMEEELFGPVMTAYIYDDENYTSTLHLCDQTSPYALTGSIFAQDRYAMLEAFEILKYAAGNFYINDKPTGAVVGQQPFGGSRASGTNDKAGSHFNLLRWVNPRVIKETLLPATDYHYPFLKK
ncbi:MAG: L-glutamate gamma-semialdehyde dehydrogenase [Bacteroidales bacterium]